MGSLPKASGDAHVLCQEIPRPVMAKANLPEQDGRERYGRVLRRASVLANFNRRETADALHVDEAQLGRWWSGIENPQTWRYQQHPVLSGTLLEAQAEAHPTATVRTSITLERKRA